MKTISSADGNVVNHEQVRNSVLNRSSSKMQYSFSKSKRFSSQNRLNYNAPFYDIPTTREARTTNFGRGTKVTFEDRRVIPASNTYTLEGDFDKQVIKKRGFSFGISRQKTNINFFKGSDAPGPGAYNPETKQSIMCAMMMGKVKDHSLDQKMKVPGPGAYNTKSLTGFGNNIDSRHSNPRLPVILKSQRTSNIKSQTPSPWAYNPTQTPKGRKSISSTLAGKFSTTKKLAIYKINDTPGPGYYNHFSQFPS